MKNLFPLLLLCLAMAASCQKEEPTPDPCEDAVCLNGGTCVNGTCNCVAPYAGPHCETDTSTADPCAGITCLNGGNCINGICQCPPQWTGPNCGQQKTPKSVTITQVDVLAFPPTDANGGGWDNNSGADIYIEIANYTTGTKLYSHPTHYADASPTATHVFDVDPDLVIANLGPDYIVRLYDYDTFNADDYMGGIYAKIYTTTNGFPATRLWDAGGIKLKVYYSYQF